MWPELFSIGPLTISPYGILVAVGFFAAIALATRLGSRHEGLETTTLWDFCLTLVLVALAGAKLLMLVTDPYYYENPSNILSWEFVRSGGRLLRRFRGRAALLHLVFPPPSLARLEGRRRLRPGRRPRAYLRPGGLLPGRLLPRPADRRSRWASSSPIRAVRWNPAS